MRFKIVPNFPDYEISEDGKTVISIKTGKAKAIRPDKNGYPRTTLFKKVDGKCKRFDYTLHVISAMTWIVGGFIPKEMEVDHIDDDKTNPHKDNLQVITKKENTLKMVHGKNSRVHLSFDDAEEIREILKFGFSCPVIADAYGVNRETVRLIGLNEIWKKEYHKGE